MKCRPWLAALLTVCCVSAARAAGPLVTDAPGAGAFPLVNAGAAAPVAYDQNDFEVVKIVSGLFSADVERATGSKPAVHPSNALPREPAKQMVFLGTLGKSPWIDSIVKAKGIDVSAIQGKWENYLIATVDAPISGVEKGLMVIGSDRRGTAYGAFALSEAAGVSPWYWWADVPVKRRQNLFVAPGPHVQASPGVKYRGIFINDEDWGLHTWALHTMEPESRGIGPKTYEKVFELMLRLRLNYLWPAMHEVTREFHSIPENVELAHRYAIVAGASHCEPMLFNNAKWNQTQLGRWDYTLNRDKIFTTWEESAKTRGDKEAVWTLGIRGIHDQGMQGPREIPTRIDIVSQVFKDQRGLLEKYVTREFGSVAQCFVPYKEVLTLYDAGLAVPEDVTLVWVDDNFGYIRRLGAPSERKRPGGAGVYWHLSYYGGPHSYLWINTSAPALMWEELHKAWENDARTLWVINVGDIKPMEIGIDYFSKFAWNPEGTGPDSQPQFLREFAAEQFGADHAPAIAELLGRFYRLGTVRKPELMTRAWAVGLPTNEAAALQQEYDALLRDEERMASTIAPEARDAYVQLIGFPARVLAASGQIFMADRAIQSGDDITANEARVANRRAFLEQQVAIFNNELAGGKWKHMMPGLVTARDLMAWNSQVRWPWGERPGAAPAQPRRDENRTWRPAASADRKSPANAARWTEITGLGHTGRALALKPAGLESTWKEGDPAAPALEFAIESTGGNREVLLDFMPTFRLYPGTQLRVAVGLDDQTPVAVEVPGSNGREDENGPNRRNGIQDNFVRAHVPLPALAPGRHVLKVRAMDPGVVFDRISLPQ